MSRNLLAQARLRRITRFPTNFQGRENRGGLAPAANRRERACRRRRRREGGGWRSRERGVNNAEEEPFYGGKNTRERVEYFSLKTIRLITQRRPREIRISNARSRTRVYVFTRIYINTCPRSRNPHSATCRETPTLVCTLKNYFRREHCVYARTPDSAGNLCFTYVNILPRPTCVSRYLSNRQEFLSLRDPMHRHLLYPSNILPTSFHRPFFPRSWLNTGYLSLSSDCESSFPNFPSHPTIFNQRSFRF